MSFRIRGLLPFIPKAHLVPATEVCGPFGASVVSGLRVWLQCTEFMV